MDDRNLDRKLRPLYDAIDARNYKLALKLVNGIQQKHENSLIVKALKALVLERVGKKKEAFQLCEQVRVCGPLNEHVLQTVLVVYKELGEFSSATKCFEDVAAAHPSNLEATKQLFQAYVRESNYVRQQQVALKLFKLQPEEKHLMMAVASMYLQGCRGSAGAAHALLAPKPTEEGRKAVHLAEMMLDKHVAAKGLKSLEALLLYLDILQSQGSLGKMLGLIQGDLKKLFSMEADRVLTEAELYFKMRQFDAAATSFQTLIELSIDDWAAYVGYLDSRFPETHTPEPAPAWLAAERDAGCEHEGASPCNEPVGTSPVDPTVAVASAAAAQETLDERVGSVGSFFRTLQEKVLASGGGALKRGPFLAELELLRRKLVCLERAAGVGVMGGGIRGGDASVPAEVAARLASCRDEIVEAVVQYFRRFGHVPSFAVDVQACLGCLRGDPGRGAVLRDRLLQECAAEGGAEAAGSSKVEGDGGKGDMPLRELKRRVSVAVVEESLGLLWPRGGAGREGRKDGKGGDGEEGDATLVAGIHRAICQLARLYASSVPVSSQLDARERAYGDNLVVIMANLLVELYRRTGASSYLHAAILTLEAGLYFSRFNSQLKLMVMDLYFLAGAPAPAMRWWESLEIKHIQLDTMLHHVLPGMLPLPSAREAAVELCGDLGRLHETHTREAGEHVIWAFNQGSVSKVREFLDFKDRLLQSYQRSQGLVEHQLLRLKGAFLSNAAQVKDLLAEINGGLDLLTHCDIATQPPATGNADASSNEGAAAAATSVTSASSLPPPRRFTFNEDLRTRPWWHRFPEVCVVGERASGPLRASSRDGPASFAPCYETGAIPHTMACARISALKRRAAIPRMLHLALSASASSAATPGTDGTSKAAAESKDSAGGGHAAPPPAAAASEMLRLLALLFVSGGEGGDTGKASGGAAPAQAADAGAGSNSLSGLQGALDRLEQLAASDVATALTASIFTAAATALLAFAALKGETDASAAAAAEGASPVAAVALLLASLKQVSSLLPQAALSAVLPNSKNAPGGEYGIICRDGKGADEQALVAARLPDSAGAMLVAVSRLVYDDLVWLATLANAWTGMFTQPKKKKGKKDDGAAGGSKGVDLEEVRHALHQLAADMATTLRQLAVPLKAHLERPAETELSAVTGSIRSAADGGDENGGGAGGGGDESGLVAGTMAAVHDLQALAQGAAGATRTVEEPYEPDGILRALVDSRRVVVTELRKVVDAVSTSIKVL
eukprot:jgi/Mesvir1/21478/Mv03930-RA.1